MAQLISGGARVQTQGSLTPEPAGYSSLCFTASGSVSLEYKGVMGGKDNVKEFGLYSPVSVTLSKSGCSY